MWQKIILEFDMTWKIKENVPTKSVQQGEHE